jgi:hypothetical protein
MKKTTAAAAAGAVALTATGAVSALFLTVGQAGSPQLAEPAATTTIVTEYVDQNGNPIAAPNGVSQDLPRFVVVESPAAEPEVIEQVEYVTTYTQPAVAAPQYQEYEEDDDEYEDHGDEDHDGYEEEEDDD